MNFKSETRQADGVTIVSCQGRIVFGDEASVLVDLAYRAEQELVDSHALDQLVPGN